MCTTASGALLGFRDQTWAIELCSKHSDPLSHPNGALQVKQPFAVGLLSVLFTLAELAQTMEAFCGRSQCTVRPHWRLWETPRLALPIRFG